MVTGTCGCTDVGTEPLNRLGWATGTDRTGEGSMSRIKLGIVGFLILAWIAVPVIIQVRSQARLRQDHQLLRQQAGRLVRVSSDNERLSNVVAQFRVAQATANDQFQELVRLRAEVQRLKQEPLQSNSVAQEVIRVQAQELARLRQELNRLKQDSEELASLQEELAQFGVALSTNAPEEGPISQPAETEEQPVSLRIIRTQGASFAEKLKLSVAAQENESFQDVFGRFLQVNGVQTNTLAASAYDERTGRVIVRAPQATLDQVEQLTSALDQAP
jgi:hypothetical protein